MKTKSVEAQAIHPVGRHGSGHGDAPPPDGHRLARAFWSAEVSLCQKPRYSFARFMLLRNRLGVESPSAVSKAMADGDVRGPRADGDVRGPGADGDVRGPGHFCHHDVQRRVSPLLRVISPWGGGLSLSLMRRSFPAKAGSSMVVSRRVPWVSVIDAPSLDCA